MRTQGDTTYGRAEAGALIASAKRENLTAIRRDSVSAVLWKRSALPEWMPAIVALSHAEESVDLVWQSPEDEVVAEALSDFLGSGKGALLPLAEDICELGRAFRDLADTERVRIRLERVEDDGCPLFHADTLRVRMLCTYAGPGTEWVEESNLRREELGSRGRSLEEANRAIVIDHARIRRIEATHVLVFKGRLWSGCEVPFVHRSAPVSASGEQRLRLTLDEADAFECPCGVSHA